MATEQMCQSQLSLFFSGHPVFRLDIEGIQIVHSEQRQKEKITASAQAEFHHALIGHLITRIVLRTGCPRKKTSKYEMYVD